MAEQVLEQVLGPAEIIAAMVAPEGRQNPYPFYEALRAHGNLLHVKPGLVVVVGYAECTRVLRDGRLEVQDDKNYDQIYPDWRSHSSLRGFTNSMLYTNPPDHGRMRRLVTSALTPRQVSGLRPTVERMSDKLLDRLAELGAGGAPVDLMAEFAFRLPVAVISELLGVPEDKQVWFRQVAADVMIALEGLTKPEELAIADRAMDDLAAYLNELIERRSAEPSDDLLSRLVQARDDDGDRLTHDELMGNLMLLLNAGFDTTTHLIGHGVLQALERPDFADRLRDEPGFPVGYVEETLRFEPPVQATSRWAPADVTIMDMEIPADTKLVVIMGAGNRDPLRFPEPDRFDPDRPDIQPLTFAAGIHYCVGAPLARMEAQIALPKLLRRFPHLAVAGEPSFRDRWLVRGHDYVPVTLG
ncbi:cytochrome P450 [Sphaerisporangium krabiense]|uniref:Cytochrome P450 n=1 Tax=Sphaerisporangium krabiense TaxID=763782 RepID=A0A7W8ZA98_9ACTN|nr:cytochrome P450 [Sphaerisporangium krabiense]MBB5630200.1 cytochrome P450 [Sphaerisporangium krabiense]GII67494.1 cytochrome P450 [Sphaerisporangium krabiense]